MFVSSTNPTFYNMMNSRNRNTGASQQELGLPTKDVFPSSVMPSNPMPNQPNNLTPSPDWQSRMLPARSNMPVIMPTPEGMPRLHSIMPSNGMPQSGIGGAPRGFLNPGIGSDRFAYHDPNTPSGGFVNSETGEVIRPTQDRLSGGLEDAIARARREGKIWF